MPSTVAEKKILSSQKTCHTMIQNMIQFLDENEENKQATKSECSCPEARKEFIIQRKSRGLYEKKRWEDKNFSCLEIQRLKEARSFLSITKEACEDLGIASSVSSTLAVHLSAILVLGAFQDNLHPDIREEHNYLPFYGEPEPEIPPIPLPPQKPKEN